MASANPTTTTKPTPIAVVVSWPALHPTTNLPIKFNKEYYLSTHLPMVAEACKPFGYLSWHFHEFFDPSPVTGEVPKYAFQTTGYYETMEGFEKAVPVLQRLSKEDRQNFAEEGLAPVIVVGKREAEWAA